MVLEFVLENGATPDKQVIETMAGGVAAFDSYEWGAGATGGWFDCDNDGRLDLFVANYLQSSPGNPPFCGEAERKIRARRRHWPMLTARRDGARSRSAS